MGVTHRMGGGRAPCFVSLLPQTQLSKPEKGDPMGLSLYANPERWLYGLWSFGAIACE